MDNEIRPLMARSGGSRGYDHSKRSYSIMSQKDIEDGKESHWSELEIRGPIKNLSPELWSFTHLTALFLNDNNLQVRYVMSRTWAVSDSECTLYVTLGVTLHFEPYTMYLSILAFNPENNAYILILMCTCICNPTDSRHHAYPHCQGDVHL